MIVENFKGIEFVRVSSLSKDQQRQLWESFDPEKIIKIIRDKSLLNDCILYSDYIAWQSSKTSERPSPSVERIPVQAALRKLAFE